MCGIFGSVGLQLPARLPLEELRHRGPDHQGWWTNGRNCVLGHTRLAVLDLNPRANQPMTDRTGRFTLVFNGKIYNYRELAKAPLSSVRLSSRSDTEVLLYLWALLGVECLRLLQGMFAFAIWDEHEQKLWLARDHLGRKPLLYTQDDKGVAFASELCALLPLLGCSPALNVAAMDLFLGYQFIPAPHSIYENVHKLPAAHYGVWHDGSWHLERYWQLEFGQEQALTEGDALDQLDLRIREATRSRLHADVPIGVLLSGGLDSSLVTAIATREYSPNTLQTFSVGFEEERFNELRYAERVAQLYQTAHESIVLRGRVDELLQRMVRQYGEPFGDKSALPSLLVCREAAKHLKVVLNGDGGDELFGGYRKYQLGHLQHVMGLWSETGYSVDAILERLSHPIADNSLPFRVLRRARYTLFPLSQVLHFDGFVRRLHQKQLYQPDVFGFIRTARQKYELRLLSELPLPRTPLSKLLTIDYRHYLANDLLVKMDIASMAFSLEARSPLLDHNLMQFAAELPARMKIRSGVGKYLLKKVAVRYLPEDLVHREKHGFSAPVSRWIKEDLSECLLDMCASQAHPLWDYCRPTTVRAWLEQHVTGRRDHGGRLWLLLILGLWLDLEGRRRKNSGWSEGLCG